MTEKELALIMSYYHVPYYVQLRLSGPVDQPTRPPPGFIAVYRDYLIRGLRLPLPLGAVESGHQPPVAKFNRGAVHGGTMGPLPRA